MDRIINRNLFTVNVSFWVCLKICNDSSTALGTGVNCYRGKDINQVYQPTNQLRLYSKLTMMYNITNGLVEVPQEYHPVPRPQNSARGHPRQFQRFQPTVDAFKYAFLPRTIPAWNALPQAVAEADSLDIFKRHMSRHLQFWPAASCTMYIVCTCSTAHWFFSGFNLLTCFRRCWSPWPRSRQ